MKTLPLIVVLALSSFSVAHSASVVINWSTLFPVSHQHSGRLSSGTPAEGDGALLQLGYFSSGTLADPFAGHWIVLASGSVGDQGSLGDGEFAITSILEESAITTPPIGTPLGVRFFNGPSIGESTKYNTGANIDGTGLWQAPSDPAPVVNLLLAKGGTRFEAPGVYQTTIPVPEPSVPLLVCLTLGGLIGRRKR